MEFKYLYILIEISTQLPYGNYCKSSAILCQHSILTMTTGKVELKAAEDVVESPATVTLEAWLLIGTLHWPC